MLALGGSNAANTADVPHRSGADARVLNLFQGRCYIANSPLLGSSGRWGDSWTRLGNLLLEQHQVDRVILIPAGVEQSRVADWKPDGRLNPLLADLLGQTRPRYAITQVLWQQGEADFLAGTDPAQYRADFLEMKETLSRGGVRAPILVAVATGCGHLATWRPDNPLAQAQRRLVASSQGILTGVDADRMLDEHDRFHQCEFAALGQEKLAAAWASALTQPGVIAPAGREREPPVKP